jgi:hypothetical protein
MFTSTIPTRGQRILQHLHDTADHKIFLLNKQEFSIDACNDAHFETKRILVSVALPHIGTSLGITLVFNEYYHLSYSTQCNSYFAILQALPPYYFHNL